MELAAIFIAAVLYGCLMIVGVKKMPKICLIDDYVAKDDVLVITNKETSS